MFKRDKAPMSEKDVKPTWEYLVKQERLLRRNRTVCRIVQPLGSLVFLFNLLLTTCNFAMFLLGDKLDFFFEAIPIVPDLVASFPRGGWGGMIAFSIFFAYLIPLAFSGITMGIFWLLDKKKYQQAEEPLVGTPAQQAKALANKAETVYELRKEIPTWAIFFETGILTALTAIPLFIALIKTAGGESPAILQIALYCLALLLVLFLLFWVYALLFKVFSLLNSLFYFSAGQWSYYELYQKLDAYWESIDPREYARREQNRREREEAKRRKGWLKRKSGEKSE